MTWPLDFSHLEVVPEEKLDLMAARLNALGDVPITFETLRAETTAAQGDATAALDKLGAYIDVTEAPYNAVGDDSTDNTVALQAAIDAVEAAGGGFVGLRPGDTYRFTSLTVDANNVVIGTIGGGKRAATLKPSGGDGIHFDGSASSIRYGGMRDVEIVSNGATGSGLKLTNSVEQVFKNIFVHGFNTVGKYGLEFVGGGANFYNTFIACTFSNNQRGAFVAGQINVFLNCRFQGNAHYGCEDTSTGVLFVGTAFEGNGSHGVNTSQNAGKSFIGCYWESNTGAQLFCLQTNGLAIVGGRMSGGAGATDKGIVLGRLTGSVPNGVQISGIKLEGHATYDIDVIGASDIEIVSLGTAVINVNTATVTGRKNIVGHSYDFGSISDHIYYNGRRFFKELSGKLDAFEGMVNVLIRNTGNLSLLSGSTGNNWGGGTKVIFIPDRTTAPTANPTGGGLLYVEAGALKWRGSGGTITTIAPA